MASPALLRRLFALPPALRRTLYSTTATTNQPDIYDVVCIGGGPAGLALLSALKANPSTQTLKIALLDAQDLGKTRDTTFVDDEYSNRCSSLTPSSVKFLRRIGVWESIASNRTQSYHAMDVWDGVSGSKIHFDSIDGQGGGLLNAVAELVPGSRFRQSRRRYESGGLDGAVATMCENTNLTRALMARTHTTDHQSALSPAPFNILDKTRVESIHLGPEPETEAALDLSQWPIINAQTPTGNNMLAARLLVGADGANSPVRRFAEIPSHGWDYNQHGVVATLHLDQHSSQSVLRTAYQRFLPTGPIALLPLPDNKASLVWSTTPQHALQLKQLPPQDFIAMVNAAFRLVPVDIDYMLNPSSTTSPSSKLSWREPATPPSSTGLPRSFPRITGLQADTVASFPLRMRHASTYTGHRVALLGDAAHTIHPLAGQGLNLGLGDAESLADRIAYGVEHGMDIGSCWCLDGYNGDRWAKNNAMLGVVDKLQKVYSATSGPVVWGRSFGVEVLERLGAVKGALMGAAAGGR